MKPLPPLQVIAYGIGNLAGGLYNAFTNFTLPLYLALFTNDAILIGWLSSTRSFEQAIVQPVVGARSDRTWTRLGRRAPFFLVAMPITALLLILNAQVPQDPALFPLVALLIVLFSLAFNIGIDPYIALLADVTPSAQRGIVNGIAQVFEFVGRVVILVSAAVLWTRRPDWIFYIVAVGLIAGFIIVALGVREPRERMHPEAKPKAVASRSRLGSLAHYLGGLWNEQREATKLLGVKIIYRFGLNAALPFLTLFVVNEIGLNGWTPLLDAVPALGSLSVLRGMSAQGVSQLVGAVLLFTTAIFAVPAGVLGDRFGKKRVFAAGLLVMGVFAVLVAFATNVPQLILYFLFLGMGTSTIAVLYFPYLSDLVPGERVGEFQGLAATAETGGVFLSVLIGGVLINLNPFNLGYRSAFILTGVFLLLGFVAVLFVKGNLQPSQVPAPVESRATV